MKILLHNGEVITCNEMVLLLEMGVASYLVAVHHPDGVERFVVADAEVHLIQGKDGPKSWTTL